VAVVDHFDWSNRRIYMAAADFHPLDLYHEYREERRTNEAARPYSSLLRYDGMVPKGGGKYTPRYMVMLGGAKIVPVDGEVEPVTTITGEIITDDQTEFIDVTPLNVRPLVRYQPPEAEVIEVATSGNEYTLDEIGVSVRSEIDLNSTRLAAIEQAIEDIQIGGAATPEQIAEAVRTEMDANSLDLNAIQDAIAGLPAAPSAADIRGEIDTNSTRFTALDQAVAAIDPPTAVEIRQEMDANSADLNTIQQAIAGLPTPPTAAAIRQEMDTNSAKLTDIHNDIAAIPAAPTPTAIRQEIDLHSSQLTAIRSDIANVPNATADGVMNKTVETGLTFLQWLRLAASALFGEGEVPTGDDGAFVFKSYPGSKNRLIGTLVDKARAFTTRDAS
jgi:hypothetical protein